MNGPRIDENMEVLWLVQAMVGAISENVRRVALDIERDEVVLWFLLARDDNGDREEVDDIAFEFESLHERGVRVRTEVVVSDAPLSTICIPGRAVFGRKES